MYFILPAAFMLGSVPFGILFTSKAGVDITKSGSGNIGATNVLRTAGKGPAVLTLLCDLLKGSLAVLLCRAMLNPMDLSVYSAEYISDYTDLWLGIACISVVLGHMYSVFLSFKGGKGVATAFGVMLVYSPVTAFIVLGIWLATAMVFKYSSLAAIVAVCSMPIILILSGVSSIKLFIVLVLAINIIAKHRSNIAALIAGTEEPIGKKIALQDEGILQ
ncbi:MAG: glycerol-3-phosphate 1-O-acyltransferase PlsY [Nitrospira sp.]|nr:glycerol-3-phosphate 1-O-acyltransferase PlsY [bacterium]MBL7049599.1 glycerol-3-phosphate 1-O-acyltransferase PlsY [Nitrospira sp.]